MKHFLFQNRTHHIQREVYEKRKYEGTSLEEKQRIYI